MMILHTTYLRSLRATVLLSALMAFWSTDLVARTEEPTLSIPRETPFKPVCVGWPEKDGCVATISAALKNAKSNGTIYVRAGSGIADNLTISKGVTICAASQKDKCLQYPTEEAKFRLIRKDETRPCIKLNFTPRPGKVTIRGMEIRDIADPGGTCIVNTKTNAGLSSVTLDRSVLEDAGLQLSGLARITITRTTIAHTYAGGTRPTWTINNAGSVDIRDGTSFFRTDLTITNSPAALSFESFEFATLNINGAGASSVTGSEFRKAGLAISGSAIRTIEGNWFADSVITLDHEGLVTFKDNVVETDPYREPATGDATLLIANGVNRISDNHFGSMCSGLPSEPGSTCECTRTPALQLAPPTAADRTTRIQGNEVCTNHPVWIGGGIGSDETVRDNCVTTYDRKVAGASRKYYGKSKIPPASELIVRLVREGQSSSCR